MKFEIQVEVLRAFAVAGNANEGVSADAIAPLVGVSPSTAGLSNAFFMESGLLERVSKGRYRAVDAVREFNRMFGFDGPAAGVVLAPILRTTWYCQAVERRLRMGASTKKDIIRVVADEAGAGKHHGMHLDNLLTWLAYATLIVIQGDAVELGPALTSGVDANAGQANGRAANEGEPESAAQMTPDPDSTPDPGRGKGEGATAPQRVPVLRFDFDFSLTAEELARLTPEQIKAVFESVGAVAAVKASVAT